MDMEQKRVPVIEVRKISKSFSGTRVLNDVSLRCRKGKIYGITGYNGSGKTVLFKCICGFYHPDKGEICINGRPLGKEMLQNAGIIIDSPAFLSGKTGMKNLELLYMLNHRLDREYLREVLRTVGLDPQSRKPVKKYSLGMRQRLAIAQALMEDPEILILDEPMNGLDKTGVAEVRTLLRECAAKGKTILLASHNREDIEILCDEVYEMEGGVLSLMAVKP